MPVQVKICGINSAAAADAALAAGADFGGLVFFPKSPRHLDLEAGRALAVRMRGQLRLAALVVDESDDMLSAIAHAIQPDFFQLHGRETPARAAEIRSRFGLPLIKAVSVAGPEDFANIARYDGVADYLLFDAKPSADASRPGGHGAAFDWQLIQGRQFAQPWFLAGGLTPENVARAIAVSGAEMVDVSSGVESAPGVKSPDRIADFIAAAKQQVRA
ncbi:MAG TPA: phosphoribosylanthranilate isomerase [Rhizomicrobium sp.]|jgi:phosphoribosylanthranilate isomerase